MSSSVLPMFSSKSFILSGHTFLSVIHFGFIFVYGIWNFSNFILLIVSVQFCQHYLLKRLSLPHFIFLPPVSKKNDTHRCTGLFLGFLSCSIGLYFYFLCQYQTILMTVVFSYNLKSGRFIPPAPFFFLKTALAI